MRPYADLTDQQLEDEIAEYRAALKKAAMGKVAVVAGEGRRVEYTPTMIGVIRSELRELYAEARERGMDIGGDEGGAIKVEIG